jgi:hypothetical protein
MFFSEESNERAFSRFMNLVCAGIRAHGHLACRHPVSLEDLFHSNSELWNKVNRLSAAPRVVEFDWP